MSNREWVVHPNRSEPGPDEPGRNGHFRAAGRPRRLPSTPEPCQVRVKLPHKLSHLAGPDGSKIFSADNWFFVVCVAHTFAREHTDVEVAPFGFKDRGQWWWWDGTTSEESILEGPDAAGYVEEFLDRLFPGMAVTVTDGR